MSSPFQRAFPFITVDLLNIKYPTNMLHLPSAEKLKWKAKALEWKMDSKFYGVDEAWCLFARGAVI